MVMHAGMIHSYCALLHVYVLPSEFGVTITQDSGSELSQDDVDNIIYKDEGSNHRDVKKCMM